MNGQLSASNSIARMLYRILILPVFGFVAVALVIGACDYMCSKRNVDGDVDLEERGANAFRRADGG